jgi:hypothetical protein
VTLMAFALFAKSHAAVKIIRNLLICFDCSTRQKRFQPAPQLLDLRCRPRELTYMSASIDPIANYTVLISHSLRPNLLTWGLTITRCLTQSLLSLASQSNPKQIPVPLSRLPLPAKEAKSSSSQPSMPPRPTKTNSILHPKLAAWPFVPLGLVWPLRLRVQLARWTLQNLTCKT